MPVEVGRLLNEEALLSFQPGGFFFYFFKVFGAEFVNWVGEGGIGVQNNQNSEKEAWRLCPLHKDDGKKTGCM